MESTLFEDAIAAGLLTRVYLWGTQTDRHTHTTQLDCGVGYGGVSLYIYTDSSVSVSGGYRAGRHIFMNVTVSLMFHL